MVRPGQFRQYGSILNAQTEIDLRSEFDFTKDGSLIEISKFHTGLLRKIRLDANDEPILCECVDAVTKEPDRDSFCPICHSEKYQWDENYVEFYKVVNEDTSVKPTTTTFYFRYDTDITTLDKIVEIELDLDGKIVEPFKRTAVHKPIGVYIFRLDSGRIEFIKVVTVEECVKFLNKPNG